METPGRPWLPIHCKLPEPMLCCRVLASGSLVPSAHLTSNPNLQLNDQPNYLSVTHLEQWMELIKQLSVLLNPLQRHDI